MTNSTLSNIQLTSNDTYVATDDIVVKAKFSIQGEVRDAFTEEKWTRSYNKNDVLFKLKYGAKITSGKLRKQELGSVDTYRKASLFWTRNPKLVNPMQKKRVWVQVAKNFQPVIKLTEHEVRSELFDFEIEFKFKASMLGQGTHTIEAQARVSWEKHDYIVQDKISIRSGSIDITIN